MVGQRLNWIASIAWGSFVVALLTLVAGIPLGVVIAMESTKFSMYFLAPILALFLMISLVLAKSNQRLTQWIDGAEKTAYQ